MRAIEFLKKPSLSNSVLTVGSFDGLHKAHQHLISEVIATAQRNQLKSYVFTFSEHPHQNKHLILTSEEKLEIMKTFEIDYIILLDRTKLNIEAMEFLEILKNYYRAKWIVLGYNHRFGKNREGDIHFILNNLEKFEFTLTVLPPFKINGEIVSSSKIRDLLKNGEIEMANYFLGYNFFIKGKVIKGKGIGRKIGFPTANLEVDKSKIIPKDGIYLVYLDNFNKFGLIHIGERETFGLERSLEVHIMNFNSDIYGETLKIYFIKRIRDIYKFESVDKLKEAIMNDIKTAYLEISKLKTPPIKAPTKTSDK